MTIFRMIPILLKLSLQDNVVLDALDADDDNNLGKNLGSLLIV
jgi:hypothetical protein